MARPERPEQICTKKKISFRPANPLPESSRGDGLSAHGAPAEAQVHQAADFTRKKALRETLFVPLNTYYRMPSVGAEVELAIRQIVREDAILLYGFATAAEKQAFDLLMSVQHVGAKLALAVLSVLSPQRSGSCDHP
jgi:RuvA N terminal domain